MGFGTMRDNRARLIPRPASRPAPPSATHGHTPGQAIYAIQSKGQKLVLCDDLMHLAALQFPNRSVTIVFDLDSKAAAAQRKKAYADAARGGYIVGSAHLSLPGLGRQIGRAHV